ncbi:3-deoxy-D-manno-octulosonic acid transferase [Panacibacter ginsenosidivorans]|uniref:3-deoxy-D-manno-octulosonic acid transferase n=1 Tax=Panacibacter ginsenosidivorans TaxID=1813871 RepID=A0A5B8V5A8_9BACT|nr:glycosyltransferase N-terminal domain-containing protein [Panacibacter ginsenosidivorans]QEC66392.1 3-deoxy-D-manno-octulosonic acid transferase [Panacibacter ginsenosidivorans]
MGKTAYLLFIKLYPLAARITALFNRKARLWIAGRKNVFANIHSSLQNDTRKKIWVHCSSLGEFEQGLPLMKELKKKYPFYCLVLTFFSPSGYENEKNNSVADRIFYMPMDSKKNAALFYETVKPVLVVFVKYEFWYYYLTEAKQRNIPLLLVSGIFRKSQPFFAWYGGFHRQMLQCFTHLFLQNEESLQLLKSIEIINTSVGGDTRFDRVLEIAETFKPITSIEEFCRNKKVIVAGSTWTDDDEALDHYVNSYKDYCFIIAPHDIGEDRLKECESLYHHSVRYSAIGTQIVEPEINTFIIDNIGTLKYLYKYADICYIGGGFGGDGVHNVLEAAVYNKPVVFGPEYEKYIEAVELLEKEGGFSVENALELEEIFNELIEDKDLYEYCAAAAGNYVRSKTGATAGVMQYIQEKRLLTS